MKKETRDLLRDLMKELGINEDELVDTLKETLKSVQEQKDKAMKRAEKSHVELRDVILTGKKDGKGYISFDVKKMNPKLLKGLCYSLKQTKVAKYDATTKLWSFDLKDKDVINKWYVDTLNYKKK